MSFDSMIELLMEQAAAQPDQPAILHEGRTYDLGWISRAVADFAAFLHHKGLRPGSVAALLIRNRRDLLLTQLAIARLGATLINLSQTDSPHLHVDLIRRTAARYLVTDDLAISEASASLCVDLVMFIALPRLADGRDDISQQRSPEPAPWERRPTAPWMYLIGSGTTGARKILPLSQRAALARGDVYRQSHGWHPSDRLACLTPLEMGFGAVRTAMAICHGGSVLLLDLADRIDPEALRSQGVTILVGGARHASQLLKDASAADRLKLDFLRVFLLGGSTVDDTLRERIVTHLTPELYVNYGCQECGPIAISRPTDPPISGSVGSVIQGAELRIVDGECRPLPPGQTGSIQVRSPGMIHRYLHDKGAAARAFDDGWFTPGDLGAIGPHGELIFKGRADHMMICDGVNIYPFEVETVIAAYPGVDDVACVPLSSDLYQDLPVCAVSLDREYDVSREDLLLFAHERLGSRRPRDIIIVPSIPRTSTGKLIRPLLYKSLTHLADHHSPLTHGLPQPDTLKRRLSASTSSLDHVEPQLPPDGQGFPGSYAQSRLWFLHQLQPGLTAYHLPCLWRLKGDLDRNALAEALTAIVDRHSPLRTSFELHGGEVMQILHPTRPFPLEIEGLGDRDPQQVIHDWQEQEASTPFDLNSGLLLRARLLEVAGDEHLLLLNQHHIASDGWSHSVLAKDLTALYNAARSGCPARLKPLKVEYHDYAARQRQRLSGDRLHRLTTYWTTQLAGLEPLALPTDHPRPASPTASGASVSFRIEPSLLKPFEGLCRAEGATLQMGLLALVALLLQRYSHQDDFAIGIPIWGRNDPDLESLIGFFVNTLPIRTRFSPDLSFRHLLDQVNNTSFEAYEHQQLPFEQIVEALNLQREASRNPLVQVLLQLIELPPVDLSHLDGLDAETLLISNHAARYELEFFFYRDDHGGLNVNLIYATGLFCADRIQRLSKHLLTLLASAAEAPDAPGRSLNLLPETEHQLIQSWQHGPKIEIPDLCVQNLFEQQVGRTPDAIALIFDDQQLTYSQLNARADQLAHQLLDLGVGPEVIVAVCLGRSVELIVALLGILKAGGAYLPLDPAWPPERRTLLLRESRCAVLITADGAKSLRDPASSTPPPALRPLAYISYTSGSTGTPKGVAIEHQAILRLVDPINGFHLGEGAAVLQLAPMAFDAATFEIWGPLLQGGTVVLAPPGTPSLAEVAACLSQHRITTLWLTAGLFHAMVDAELEALAAVTQIIAGGDVLHPASVRRLLAAFPSGHALINGYGPTEGTTFTCCQRLGPDAPLTTDAVPIGTPIANTTVRVLDASGYPCPIGIPGELHIGGDGLARGYLNNPELTGDTFIPDSYSGDPSARLYKSGDLVSWNRDGTLAFHGRIDQQIKLRGFRIEPGEIEATLLAHPDVAQVAVVLRRDDPANPRLIAYWVSHQHDLSADARAAELRSTEPLRAFLAERLPDSMVPSAFVALSALPLTTNGKLDHTALPAPSFAGDLSQRLKPSSDLERQLHGIWAEVLGHSDFGITDNFWLVGGDSLAAAGLVARIAAKLGRTIPVQAIFRCPTISGQVNWLLEPPSQAPSQMPGHLVILQPMGSPAPLHVVHGWGGRVGSFIPLARALAPHRPVLGLQASSDGSPPQGTSVTQLADAYAEEILAAHRGGPIHLMGYSVGGWYAYAVAAALLERKASIGLLAILDTHGIKRHLQGMGPHTQEPFVKLLTQGYRPPRLPLTVHLFTPELNLPALGRLWRFYAKGGVHSTPLFENHLDFFEHEHAPELAQALETTLQHVEQNPADTLTSRHPHRSPGPGR